jgi:hypothetical protein
MYDHNDGTITPNQIEISDLISPPDHKILMLGGVSGMGRDGRRQELDDVDSGMIGIAALWRTKCGLRLGVGTM